MITSFSSPATESLLTLLAWISLVDLLILFFLKRKASYFYIHGISGFFTFTLRKTIIGLMIKTLQTGTVVLII